jgi:hypothetical protein
MEKFNITYCCKSSKKKLTSSAAAVASDITLKYEAVSIIFKTGAANYTAVVVAHCNCRP